MYMKLLKIFHQTKLFNTQLFFRQEAVGIKKAPGQAKVIGTVVCVAGAMVLSFYHGHTIGIGESKIHWAYAENIARQGPNSTGSNFFLGPFLIMAAAVSWAVWFIIQVIS